MPTKASGERASMLRVAEYRHGLDAHAVGRVPFTVITDGYSFEAQLGRDNMRHINVVIVSTGDGICVWDVLELRSATGATLAAALNTSLRPLFEQGATMAAVAVGNASSNGVAFGADDRSLQTISGSNALLLKDPSATRPCWLWAR
jgi:hypothetical protein